MKRFISAVLSAAVVFSFAAILSSCGGKESDAIVTEAEYTRDLSGTTLKVYNWGEYISDGSEGTMNVNKVFEDLTGIKVEYSTYDDNETLYSKLASGASYYDIIIPSDYMIERLIREDMLKTIDVTALTNYHYIDDEYKNLYFDPENSYSVPYNVGMVGLIYNKNMVTEAPDSWKALWNADYAGNILMFDNPRDAFGIAQFILGQDLNTVDKADWDAAAELLKNQNPILQSYVMDEVFNKMEDSNAAMAPYYAGDYLTMLENNPDLGFVYPKEGVNVFCDSVCVPKSTQNYEAALMYIDFLMEPEVALANAERLCYASPNTSVTNNDKYTYKDNKILYPEADKKPQTQWFHDMDADTVSYYEALWVDVKNS